MSYTFIGVTSGSLENQVCIGIIRFSNRTVCSKSFLLDPVCYSEVVRMFSRKVFSSDLLDVGKFLLFNIPDPSKTQVIAEIPSGFLSGSSVLLKLFIFLTFLGYCDGLDCLPIRKKDFLAGFNDYSKRLDPALSQEKNWVVLLPHKYYNVLDESGNVVQGIASYDTPLVRRKYQRGFIYLNVNTSRAYSNFLLQKPVAVEAASIILALIATNDSLYHFFNSHGLVLSLEDIVASMVSYEELREKGKQLKTYGCSAVSGEDVYTITIDENTLTEKADGVALWYKIQCKKHKFLDNRDAIKFALLHVCKRWAMKLSCLSLSDIHCSYPNVFLKESTDFRSGWKYLGAQSSQLHLSGDTIYTPGETLASWVLDTLQRCN